MSDLSARNFGLLIAYVIPGFAVLLGLSSASDGIRLWLVGSAEVGPGVGSFFYVLLASVGLGMTASVIRWAMLDTLHALFGLSRPRWNEAKLQEKLTAFDYLVESRYRYYQFYGNMLVALPIAYAAWRIGGGRSCIVAGGTELALALLILVFAAGSRDALRKYYAGGTSLLGLAFKELTHDEWKSQRRNREINGHEKGYKGKGVRNATH